MRNEITSIAEIKPVLIENNQKDIKCMLVNQSKAGKHIDFMQLKSKSAATQYAL